MRLVVLRRSIRERIPIGSGSEGPELFQLQIYWQDPRDRHMIATIRSPLRFKSKRSVAVCPGLQTSLKCATNFLSVRV